MNLKELRLTKGLNQKECAEYLGMSTRSYQTYENDASKIGSDKYNVICNKLEWFVREDSFSYGKGNKSGFTSYDQMSKAGKFETDILFGESLKRFIEVAKPLKRRKMVSEIDAYINSREYGRVFVMYGLRRTGKTTMIKQAILGMSDEQLSKTAFIQINSSNNLGEVNRDLRILMERDYKYVFIDEVTMMGDFIEGASLLSDIYSSSGMKIILSGTDSLGFWISRSNQLYDRCIMLHTTFIPYKEFEEVLGIEGVDQYIQYGGTMSMSGEYYNTFSSSQATDEYIDSAISRNIQHSLKCYQDGGHFRHLYSLYERNELTSAINRIVEDINHRFTVDVLTKDFKSSDLSISQRNLRKENDILDYIDREEVTKRLKEILEIKNRKEQNVEIDSYHVTEIEEYLKALDIIYEIPLVDIDHLGENEKKTVYTQPGLRYSQAKALIESLVEDNTFATLSFNDRKLVSERILSEIKGRMLEDLILLETAIAKPDMEVFKLQFSDGEYDMVVFDSKNGGCLLYEIKYSSVIDKNQVRHLTDEEKLKKTAYRYGDVKGRYVIYRGEAKLVSGIQYLNVEDYLKGL